MDIEVFIKKCENIHKMMEPFVKIADIQVVISLYEVTIFEHYFKQKKTLNGH